MNNIALKERYQLLRVKSYLKTGHNPNSKLKEKNELVKEDARRGLSF
jgi:hypothetical protein